jgi:tRNA-modifying protein YgfZ
MLCFSAMTTTLPASDYAAVTETVGLLDRSERGKLALSGADAKAFLQGQVSNDTEALTPGTGCYAAFLTPKGKMLGDLRILDTGDELLLDTERSALQELFNMIRRFSIGYEVELHKRTMERGLLSLIGPGADALLADAGVGSGLGTGTGLGAAEHANALVEISGVNALAIRTDVGVDFLCDAEAAAALAAALRDAGASDVGPEAPECVRVENGRPRYGVDLDATVIPQEAGLNERAVSFTKGCYVGQETVARLFYRGKPNRQLRGLRCTEPVSAGDELTFEDKLVGRVSSAVVSPRYGPIALAIVRREAPAGSTVTVGAASGTVVELPFTRST